MITLDQNQIITYIDVDGKDYIAYVESKTPSDEDDVLFGTIDKLENGLTIILPILNTEILNKVIEKYDKYIELMSSEDELEEEEDFE